MARSRNIKPGLFTNEILGEADPLTVLTFVGLWTLADKEGRLECRSKKIRAQLFPYRVDIDIDQSLAWLMHESFISCYSIKDKSYIQILNWSKHQSPHHKEIESTIPSEGKGAVKINLSKNSISKQQDSQARLKHDSFMDQASVNGIASTPLIPDSLNSDSSLLIPDSGSSDSLKVTATAKQSPPPKKSGEAKSTAIWEAYRQAYRKRYQVDPVRNAKTNKQLCLVVDRLGADDAPLVAEFYVIHNNGFYVGRMHTVDLLLNDCEKLRTEWITNRQMTNTQARDVDRKQTTYSAVQAVIAKTGGQQ